VFTLEPVLYDEKAFKYIRTGEWPSDGAGVYIIDDDVVVTASGVESLTPLSKELYIVR
jgi:hypothetical protein